MRALRAADVVCEAMPEVRAADVTDATTAEYVAWVQVTAGAEAATWEQAGEQTREQTWQRLCWQVTARLELVEGQAEGVKNKERGHAGSDGADGSDGAGALACGAVLALGWCAAGEAQAVAQGLARRLAAAGFRARVGVGPSATLAQLALWLGSQGQRGKPGQQGYSGRLTRRSSGVGRGGSAGETVYLVTPEEAAGLLARTPVAALARVHPRGVVTAETVERLRRYGLRTLGQVARLLAQVGEVALRRQFGAQVGSALVALARGQDIRPLQPSARPETLRFRMRWMVGAAPGQVSAGLGRLAERVAGTLAEREQAAGVLRLRVGWASGGSSEQEVRLRERVGGQEGRRLADVLRMLWGEIAGEMGEMGERAQGATEATVGEVADLMVEVGDLAAVRPGQTSFWDTSAQRAGALRALRARVRARFGGGVQGSGHGIGQVVWVAPEAVFAEERYTVVGDDGDADDATGNHARGRRDRADGISGVGGAAGDGMARGDAWAEVPMRLHWW